MNDFGVEPPNEHLHDHLRLVQSQQTMIDKNASQLIADCAMNECRRDT